MTLLAKDPMRFLSLVCVLSLLQGCSTTGNFYKENDPQDGEFSTIRTILLPVAIAGVVILVLAIAQSPNSGSGWSEDPRWDYQPVSNTWACRNATNGEFLPYRRCQGVRLVDSWPNN